MKHFSHSCCVNAPSTALRVLNQGNRWPADPMFSVLGMYAPRIGAVVSAIAALSARNKPAAISRRLFPQQQ